ncbi:O-acetyl-ADP-ribose deacetylase (regulator of RNase III), contains Macro domain [Anaerosphaera aminiphila DSM 21120]|uniref:O-acetyl-ADP-ribose deacetylase (Regulator of RNase III), contains Macro domain n=1 Tax=Anaerosphaera aminiphila DSM 21120 TaxID=1120995 RepID=A0A1M5RQB8_9FIRM|nr:macro domain-containing protein [Anaerosphaera aminiphila]SHH28396.1 O-acetyl-ADP-ribose deacetylase (regulator of RNase III), contains Macro domain [Anaerosphaera aminiphila DSM 21120]
MLNIIEGDILSLSCECIVNAANSELKMGGGVCGAIFRAAGEKQLQEECNSIGYCKTGEAVITKGYNLKAKYIIHTVGPVYRGGKSGERELLYSCYINSLELARKSNISSIAFPLISSGIYGYPYEEALEVAKEAIEEFLNEFDMRVYLVLKRA